MLFYAPYILSFVFVVCWFKHNAAISFAARSSDANRMQHAFKDKKMDSQHYDNPTQFRVARKTNSSDISLRRDNAKPIHNVKRNKNVNVNMNMNMNMNILGYHGQREHDKVKHETSTKPDQPHLLENFSEILVNCSSNKKENQRYSSSFIGSETSRMLNVDKEFKDVVGNNSKAKTISSVHEDEDITLCWIETTTIKENKTVRPSRKLVIREYTISFENSATIPDKYLECKQFEGELTTDDKEIGKKILFEVIDEDTKVSKVVNFTSVSHVGDIIVWQYKKVKCGVGPVVTKNIVEWSDGSKNPKKRVEIKVGPKMHRLTATKPNEKEEEELCTESSVEEERESSKPTDITTEACENGGSGTCEVTTKSVDTSTKSSIAASSSKEVTKSPKNESSSESNENISLSTGVTEASILSSNKLITSTIVSEENTAWCEKHPSDPLCTQEISSSKELFTESVTKATTESSTRKENVDIFNKTESLTFSSEPTEEALKLVTEEPTLLATTDKEPITSSVEKEKEEHLTSKEDISPELTSIYTSEENDITTKISPYEFTEFVEESEKITEMLNNLFESTTTESTFASATQSISSFEESTISETQELSTIGLKTTVEKEATTPMFLTITSSTETKPTLASKESESCENSGNCSYATSSESCDISGNCTKDTDESQAQSETSTKDQSFVTESSEKSSTIEIQHTTVASVATTVLTTQEAENNSTAINNVNTTQRSTTTSMPQHKLTLKVIVLLEHISEKKEKHNLIDVEKNLSFVVNSAQHSHSDLLEQLKLLNESVNRETLKALLNVGSLIQKPNIIYTQLNKDIEGIHQEEYELNPSFYEELSSEHPSVYKELISEQSETIPEDDHVGSEYFQYPEYEETNQENDQEIEVASRRRRSVDDKIKDLAGLDIVRKNPTGADKSSVNLNVSGDEYQTTTNNPKKDIINATYIENKRNVTKEKNDNVIFLTVQNKTDISTLDYQDVTKSIVSTTTNNSEQETNDIVLTESGNNTIEKIILSTVPLIKKNDNIETKIRVVKQTLPEIQEDVSAGLKHVVLKLTQNSSINDVKKVVQRSLLGIIANPKDNRIHSRVRRAAAEEVGHWSNERIKEAPMGGSLRSFIEFTLYKVFL